jgi:hypothetical protein
VSIREARLLELEGEWRRRRRRRGEARGAWARQEGDREGRGGEGRVYAKPTVESGVVSTACAGFLLRAHARREHLGLLGLCVVLGVGTYQLVWVLWFYN